MYLKVNGVNLYYDQTGQGEPLVLLHGNGEDHRIFDELVRELSHRFTVYRLDSRGHGKSERVKTIFYDRMAEDTAAFIRELGLERPALYGFSDGGITGLLLAIRYPELLSKLAVSGANLCPEGLKGRCLTLFRISGFFTRSPLTRMMLTEPHIPLNELERVAVPVLVLAGARDIVREAHTREIAAHIPNSRLEILAHETHSSYVVHTPRLAEWLVPFLKEDLLAAHSVEEIESLDTSGGK